ncbi:MAG: ATP-binding protein [Desulfobulbus sp.]|nr:ATP-binding protein [Desulfobulbus sp.]
MIWSRSIRIRLFVWSFAFTALMLIAIGWFLLHEVKVIIIDAIDNALHSKEQLITGLLHVEHDDIDLELSEIILGEYSIPRSGHYYKVLLDGQILAASPSLVDEGFDLASGPLEFMNADKNIKVYTSTGPNKEPIRTLHHSFKAYGRTFDIFVAESIRDNIAMINAFQHFLLIVMPLCILTVCLVSGWIIKRSLKPLDVFSFSIRRITPKSLGDRLEVKAEAQELCGIAASFNEMLGRLQKAFESEQRLISDASHELKTPVSVIKAHCDVLLQKERTVDEYREALETIREISNNMGRLTKDLLSLARLDAGRFSPMGFREISLKNCVQKALRLTLPLAEHRSVNITLSLAEDLIVNGDEDRLSEAFLNLIENAICYNRENGSVEISAGKENGVVRLTVADTGTGIAEEDRERIFDRFYRADVARGTEGTGLGLSIVKSIIKNHHGTIEVESKPGRGSSFSVILPQPLLPVVHFPGSTSQSGS